METNRYPPAEDPEKIPRPDVEEPDYDDPIVEPDTGALPETGPEDDEEDDPRDLPLRA